MSLPHNAVRIDDTGFPLATQEPLEAAEDQPWSSKPTIPTHEEWKDPPSRMAVPAQSTFSLPTALEPRCSPILGRITPFPLDQTAPSERPSQSGAPSTLAALTEDEYA